jgi:hypothetical protein
VISVGDRLRDRVDQAKSGLSEADYSVRKMVIEYLRFNVIGALNVTFFFVLNFLLSWLDLCAYMSLSVWAPSWLIGALEAHAAHRWVTFRSQAAYRESLMWAYVVYGVTAIMSTLAVFLLADVFHVNYWIVWAMNTLTFGFATFLGLRYLAFPPSLDAECDTDGRLEGEVTGEFWRR